MKKIFPMIALLLLVVLGGCTDTSDSQTPPVQVEPKIVFDLPEGWRRFEDNPLYAYSPDANYRFQNGDEAPGPADLALQYSLKNSSQSAEQMRDEFYQERAKQCDEEGVDKESCLKLLRKEQIKVDQVDVYLIHYEGDNFMPGSKSTQAFWEKENTIDQLMLNGDFQSRLEGLKSVVRTIRYQ